MESNDELKEIDIKNCACYFDNIIKPKDFDLNNILINEKSYEHFGLWHFIQNSHWSKTLRIRFDKLHGFIGVYHETIYLVIFGPEKYDAIYNRIRYLIGVKGWYNLC